MVSIICFFLVFGISRLGHCPGGSYGGGGYKGAGSYYGKGGYQGGEPISDTINKPSTSPTLGQELIDLEAAYKQGIINEEEYERLKMLVIEQRTKR